MPDKKLLSPTTVPASRAPLARGPPLRRADFPVVGLGASADDLEALTKRIADLPDDSGMGYILVQHLDPRHVSRLDELLAEHKEMRVLHAADGMIVERNHIYVIPQAVDLSFVAGALHFSRSAAPHGARMPVDFLLESMANELDDRADAVILSGTRPQSAIADLCRHVVLENLAPATVVINRNHDCLYSMGPTERYLRVARGYATQDLLAMMTSALRTRLRSALGQVTREVSHVVVAGGYTQQDGCTVPFDLEIRLVIHQGEDLLLISFVDRHGSSTERGTKATTPEEQSVAGLQHELELAKTDLSAAMHHLEMSDAEHRAANEEALSVNEEYQSANEELLTSKEELQSLNEELTALNGQLQEALERQRTTANDLQNVLYSTKVATLFLDSELRIRFFTPATKKLFHLIPGDIGRPLADLHALAIDPMLAQDARAVLVDCTAHDCEVAAPDNSWFLRHIMPYRTDAGSVEGVVITFTDITEKKRSRAALEAAKRGAEQANLAKSRFLAATSHDLRQPLQSLALLQGLLEAKVKDPAAEDLLGRLAQTLVTMSAMLNTLPDINQIEAGMVEATPVDFVIGDLVARVCDEFTEQARAQKLVTDVAPLPRVHSPAGEPTIYIVDDDCDVRRSLRELLETNGRNVEDFGDCEAFLAAYQPGGEACLLIDAYLPGIDGIELLRQLKSAGSHLPAIMITGSSAVPMAVEAMKVGAIDFIEKPVSWPDLLASVNRALLLSRDEAKLLDWQADAVLHLKGLTPRQHQVMELVLAGHPSKNIAADLGISQRTVENHRASIMKKTGAKSLPALARLALAATGSVSAA